MSKSSSSASGKRQALQKRLSPEAFRAQRAQATTTVTKNTDHCRQRLSVAATPLQEQLLRLCGVLSDVRELSEREQATFGSIAMRAIACSLGGPMTVDEAEDILRLAA
jgi:hypothetical protein